MPDEACQIVGSGTNEILGRITSSRFSPTLGRSICLAQIARSQSVPGTELTIVLTDGERITGTVKAGHAFYDPDGERVRG